MHADHARPDEVNDALTLVFGHLRPDECRARAAHARRLIDAGGVDVRGLFVARGTAGVVGAMLCTPLDGGGSLVWPPAGLGAAGLVAAACGWLRAGGASLAQCLLPPDEAGLAPALLRNGFTHVTDLHYLCHDLFLSAAMAAVPHRLRLVPFDPDRPDEFRRALGRTYAGSLDCPEVDGLRTLDETIEAHKTQGKFDPAHWWLAYDGGEPAGVLLLMEQHEPGDWEVVYVGVVPESRGRGVGRQLMLHALCEVRAAGGTRVVLSVDARNVPARELYRGLGFEEFDRRLVILATWR